MASKYRFLSIGKEFPQFTNEELNTYISHYESFDLDSNEEIDRNELRNMMEKLNQKVDDDKLDDIIKEVDRRGKGTIDFRDFLSVMDKIKKGQSTTQFGELYLAAVKEKVLFFEDSVTKEQTKKMQNLKIVEENKQKTQEQKEKKRQENEAYDAEKERKRKEVEDKKQQEVSKMQEIADRAKNPKESKSSPSVGEPDEDTKQKLAEKAKQLEQQRKADAEKERQKKEQMASRNKQFEQPQEKEIKKTQVEVKGNVSDAKSKFQPKP